MSDRIKDILKKIEKRKQNRELETKPVKEEYMNFSDANESIRRLPPDTENTIKRKNSD